MDDLYDKGAFVTGAASGIGLAIAAACARAGMRVMLVDVEAEALDEAMDDLDELGLDAMSTVCDVADPASVEAAAARTFKDMGSVHLLVNNAGVAVGGPMHEVALADWDWILGVNLKGVVHGIHHFVPHMLAHGEGGHVVNTASLSGMVAPPGMGPYAATKFAVVALSEALRAELAEQGIGVSALCPGYVKTRINDSARNRPTVYGGPRPPVETPLGVRARGLVEAGLDPDRVAQAVLAAVRADEPYIFTHPEFSDAVRERFTAIEQALDALEK